MALDRDRRQQMLWRAHHRGTREADMLVGGFADRWIGEMTEAEARWFEALLDEQDVDIMAWAFGRGTPPAHLEGAMFERLQRLDYIRLVER